MPEFPVELLCRVVALAPARTITNPASQSASSSRLSVELDVFTRATRGSSLARHLTEELSKAALERALESHRPESHHSGKARAICSDWLHSAVGSRPRPDQHGSSGPADGKCLCRALDADASREEAGYVHEYRDLEDARQHIGRFLDEV